MTQMLKHRNGLLCERVKVRSEVDIQSCCLQQNGLDKVAF